MITPLKVIELSLRVVTGVDRPDTDGPLERDGGRVELPGASGEVRHRDAVAGEIRDLAAYHADLRAAVAPEFEGTRETRADGRAWQGDGTATWTVYQRGIRYSDERGDTQNELVPIGEDEASRIIEPIRRKAGSAPRD